MLRPHALINSHGKPYFGRFAQPVNEINVRDADYRTPMNKKAGWLKKHFNYKRFQYFGGIADDLIFGCALADLRYIGAVFVYIYRPSDKTMRTWQYKVPLGYGLNMTDRPDNGTSTFKLGKKKIVMDYQLNSAGERRKQLNIDFGHELKIEAQMKEPCDFEAMALCTPTAVNGWIYAQKTAALAVSGSIQSEFGMADFETINCFGHHDFSAGFMRRETFWNWACFSGKNENQPAIGLNVSWGVNETGYSENCFWIGNTLHQLPQTQFKFDRDNIHSSWRISTENDQINLAFTPEGAHTERLNAGFMATNFKQIFGKFNGYIKTKDGKRYDIENQYGFVEDQYSKW